MNNTKYAVKIPVDLLVSFAKMLSFTSFILRDGSLRRGGRRTILGNKGDIKASNKNKMCRTETDTMKR